MAPFDECCVLIPSATLEDFPTNAADFDARSILAAWTVLWHPQLLAQTEQLPTWYRADSPPDIDGPRIVVVPTLSVDQLPRGYEAKCQKQGDCRWITGETREEMLAALDLAPSPTLKTDHRELDICDFFAAGFASLQIQVMTPPFALHQQSGRNPSSESHRRGSQGIRRWRRQRIRRCTSRCVRLSGRRARSLLFLGPTFD